MHFLVVHKTGPTKGSQIYFIVILLLSLFIVQKERNFQLYPLHGTQVYADPIAIPIKSSHAMMVTMEHSQSTPCPSGTPSAEDESMHPNASFSHSPTATPWYLKLCTNQYSKIQWLQHQQPLPSADNKSTNKLPLIENQKRAMHTLSLSPPSSRHRKHNIN